MASIRSKLWASIIKRAIKKTGEIKDITNTRRDFSGNNKSFLANYWKKKKQINYLNFNIDGLPVLRLENKEIQSNKTLLYLHGGGYVACGPETHGALITELSLLSKSHVLFPIYRLAPENPFPAAIEDAISSYQYLLEEGINPKDIFIAGDSAGGGLTMALLQKIKEKNLPNPSCAIVISPWTDLTLSGKSMIERKDRDPMLTTGPGMNMLVKAYCGEEDPKNPLISCIFADLEGMPPIQIQVASEEVIYDDSIRLQDRLKKYEDNEVEFIEWDGLFHVFQAFCSGWLAIPEAKKSIKEMAKYSNRYIT
ncbi:MAG: alpha/beta hydrolase [Pseudomonadota bacterium]|nr:alpha/beta hydrolase [Pseudomonadota bacterium]